MKIFKYTLPEPLPLTAHVVDLELPETGWFLSAKEQDGEIRIWMMVDPEEQKITRRFLVQGTGHDIEHNIDDLLYYDTVKRGAYVWHIFELAPVNL